ncbi:heme ABC exporter ATP-binding protein CcmA [Pseudooceanicola sp.]|uniref:heme ABC exporter ATP-binding protein CcmA n=1 Tax=Pseudooceanicola sp. TaxID=1914328 RepID=UPI00261520EB|nr:heme ABC exporter ATP-binding protein CcmA [Pseudooceanicola sp.]MDF1856874.1 heme ABC exporter ATP-binding protein CcmA [Pseudooceanicola sp.]
MELVVDQLSVARAGVPVLRGVAFRLAPGRALLLRGPNGVGKTTLLRVLAGLQPPLAGRVSLDPDNFAYAAHADGIKSTLSVAENLNFWADLHGTRGSTGIEVALAAFHLSDLAERAAGALSAGQKRRLGLARLLVTGRPIWILDEPTVSLDRDAVTWFADVVRAHLANGGSAIIASHIELGLDAEVIELEPFRASWSSATNDTDFDEAFL